VKPLFHLTSTAAWAQARAAGLYEGDTLKTEGFIHCSLAHQVVEVANRLFRGRTDLVLLTIDEDAVGPEVRYENLEGGAEQYPHIYGPLNLDAIRAHEPFLPDEDGRFVWSATKA
jgi:uncharacterized protein (DUF952 family)